MAILLLPTIVALLLGLTTPAGAEPISGIIGLTALLTSTIGPTVAIGGAVVTAGAIGGVIVSVGLAVGASLLSRALGPKQPDGVTDATTSGVQTSVRIGADVPRVRVFGKQMLAGQLAYWNLYGQDNRWLQLVFVLGSGPHDLFNVFADGKALTLGTATDSKGQPINDYIYADLPLGFVQFYAGEEVPTADADLIAHAEPAGRWTSANVGVGVCYARVTMFYWPEVFQNGIPQFQFEIGARLYDPRMDSTQGGVGPHLWSDWTTWEFSDNPAVAAYNFERGLYVNQQRVIGRGLAPADIIRTMFIDAANVCDEIVALKDETTEKRYRIGMIVGADRDLKSVESDMMIAMAGSLVESAGAWGVFAGAAKPIVATLHDDDFVTGKAVTFSPKKPRDQIVNALFGTYTDPAQNYQPIPYAPRTSSADEAADHERFQVKRDYPQVQSQTQAQRIGEIERRDARFQASAGGTLGFQYSFLEAGDWVRWVSVRRNFDATFRIKSHRISADQTIELQFDQTSADVFDFDPEISELDPLAPGDLPGIGELLSVVPDFDVVGTQVYGTGGVMIPALACSWSPITDRTVDGVLIQYRTTADPDNTLKTSPFYPPDDGGAIVTDGVQAATEYEARAAITTTPARPVFFTAWVTATAGAQHIVTHALTSDTAIITSVEAADIIGQIVGAQIENAAITAAKLAADAVTATAFAEGIEPVVIATTLPNPVGYTGPLTVFNTTDGKLYRYFGGAWTAAVPTTELSGQIVATQIADAAITSAKLHTDAITATAFAAGIEPIAIGSILPGTPGADDPKTFFNTTDGKLYRYTGGAWTKAVDGGDITAATITGGKIVAGAISTTELAASAVTATIIAAGAVTATKLAVASGSSNRVPNSDFLGGLMSGQYSFGHNTGLTVEGPAIWPSTTWHPTGMNSIYFRINGTPAAGTFGSLSFGLPDNAGVFRYYPVVAGKRYEISAYYSAHRCSARMDIIWVNAAGTYAGEHNGNTIGPGLGGNDLANWPRSVIIATAPPTAVQGYLRSLTFYTGAVGDADPYTFMSGLFFGEANANQTEPSAWAPGGQTVISGGQIITDSITATQIAANAITANEIAANTITASNIAAGTITATQMATDTLTAGTIAAGAINTSELAANAVTATIIGAGAVTTQKLAVGTGGGNRIWNSDFTGGIRGVGAGHSSGYPFSGPFQNTDWNPKGMASAYIYLAAPPAGTTADMVFLMPTVGAGTQYYPVEPGKRYEFSAYISVHRAIAYVLPVFLDSNGNYVGEGAGNVINTFGAPGNMAIIGRSVSFTTAPSNATQIYLIVRTEYSGGVDCYTFVSGLFLDEANANQTEPTPWAPGGATVIDGGQIVTRSIVADRIVANTITAGEIAAGAITADEIAANVIHAGHLRTDTLVVTTSAQIATLIVDQIHIKDAAVTAPAFQNNGAVGMGGGDGEHQLALFYIPFRGVAGKTVTVNGQATILMTPISPPSLGSARMIIQGVQVTGIDQEVNQGSTTTALIGSLDITANGGAESVYVQVLGHVNPGLTGLSMQCTLFGVAYIR